MSLVGPLGDAPSLDLFSAEGEHAQLGTADRRIASDSGTKASPHVL
jgi:hypothetical protein